MGYHPCCASYSKNECLTTCISSLILSGSLLDFFVFLEVVTFTTN